MFSILTSQLDQQDRGSFFYKSRLCQCQCQCQYPLWCQYQSICQNGVFCCVLVVVTGVNALRVELGFGFYWVRVLVRVSFFFPSAF